MNQIVSMFSRYFKLSLSVRAVRSFIFVSYVWHVNTTFVLSVCALTCRIYPYRVDRGALLRSGSAGQLRSEPPGDLQGPAGPANSTSRPCRS